MMYNNNNICLSLYKRVYKDNKHFCYTRQCISYYTRRCIMRVYNDNIYLSLYKRVYNDNKNFFHT